MGLEVGDGFISGLVATNPVGATDPKSQGDDHIRLIKTALLGTFPNLSAAVSLTAAQINDAALKSASNTFTVEQVITADDDDDTLQLKGASGRIIFTAYDTAASTNGAMLRSLNLTASAFLPLKLWALTHNFVGQNSGTLADFTFNGVSASDFARLSQSNAFTNTASWTSAGDQNHLTITAATVNSFYGSGTANARLGTSSNHPFFFYTNNTKVGEIAADGVWTLNGVAQTDFARLSQNNVFTQPQNVTVSGADANFTATRSGAASAVLSGSSSYAIIGSLSNHPVAFIANSTTSMEISAAGNFDFKAGTVTTSNASASEVGPVGTPRRSISSSGNTAASDAGRSVHFDGGSGQTFTLDSDPPADSIVVLVNRSGANWTIAASGTLTQGGTTGNRTMATGSFASAYHIGSGDWYISGNGLS